MDKEGERVKEEKVQVAQVETSSMEDDSKLLLWPAARVRQTFLDFFATQHQHTLWPSSPVAPLLEHDPTLLFTNAGMNQFKPLFLGTCDPNLEMSALRRAVNAQKCIRAGGKHNDLDQVGHDVYHHTFFEMLGNWSFQGEYDKQEAIHMAWQCLTTEFKLDPDRLYATYFAGDETTPKDQEARDTWLQLLPPNRVLPCAAKDNFWEMGPTGPCGPCTEIHYDRIGQRDAAHLVNADVPDVLEIWNLVFIQYNRESDGSLRLLPSQHVDTGMGLERLTSILQQEQSNYDTDLFRPLFTAIHQQLVLNHNSNHNTEESQSIFVPQKYQGRVGPVDDPDYIDTAYRVIADHIRTLVMALADGAVPSAEGRGYVLRRILRRAIRYGRQYLHAPLGFFAQLVPTVVHMLGDAYPELVTQQSYVMQLIREEEDTFSRTLDKGLLKFQELANQQQQQQQQQESQALLFSGDDAHFLYTTLGFPVDLTELMAHERGMQLDKAAFEARMQHEQALSAAARKQQQQQRLMITTMQNHTTHNKNNNDQQPPPPQKFKEMDLQAEQTHHLAANLSIAATDDSAKFVWNQDLTGCVVQALFVGRNETEDKIGFVNTVNAESWLVGIVLDQTSFYAEAGGQVFDTGVLLATSTSAATGTTTTTTTRIHITSVQQYGQFVLHLGMVEANAATDSDSVGSRSTVSVGDGITCQVDYARRTRVAANHTMTHVLNYALRDVLVTTTTRDNSDTSSTTSPSSSSSSSLVDQKGSLVDETKLRLDVSWNAPLSPTQIAAVERLCVDWIEQAIPVDAVVAPLALARQIRGVRAVFGEKYPDPVRIVTMAPPTVTTTTESESESEPSTDRTTLTMKLLLSDPSNAVWQQCSIEFCGGTHLSNTRDARAFCILSEEGIAKGIRRIVAVSGDAAIRAQTVATEFGTRLHQATTTITTATTEAAEEELEVQVKALTNELNSLTISAIQKHTFRESLSTLSKKVIAYKKQKMAGMTDAIVQQVVDEAAQVTTGVKVVIRSDFGVDGKLGKSIVTAVHKKVPNKAIFLVSADVESDRFLMLVSAPKEVDVDCQSWAGLAAQGLDAKGGGKKDSVLLNAQGIHVIDSVMAKARLL